MIKDEDLKALLLKKQRAYGDFKQNCIFTFDFYQKNLTENKILATLDPAKQKSAYVSLLMMGLKLARLKNEPTHEDSINDFFGYLELFKKNVGVKIKIHLDTDSRELLKIRNEANKKLESQ